MKTTNGNSEKNDGDGGESDLLQLGQRKSPLDCENT